MAARLTCLNDTRMPRGKRQSLAEAHPEIAIEWDFERNGDMSPNDVARTSSQMVHWKCKHRHTWEAQVRTRTLEQTRCPYCSGRLPSSENNLAVKRPDLVREWNYEKNGSKKPEDYLPASMASVWWICSKSHEWKVPISNRYDGNNCPYCSNRKVGYGNDLTSTHPDLASQWHPAKNGKLKPSAFVGGSKKRVWWQCSHGHDWKAQIGERVNGTGCPYCVKSAGGRRGASLASPDYNFALSCPDAASEWLQAENGRIKPENVTPNSGRKFWFQCSKGHEYQSTPARRSAGQGCSYCAGKLVAKNQSLAAVYPDIAAQWDSDKNPSSPNSFTPHSRKHAWWLCDKGHSWKAVIGNRSGRKSGCPFCAPTNKRASKENNITVTNPDLMEEWDVEANKGVDPKKLLAGSTRKVAWMCFRGHTWRAVVGSRATGRGCPKCRTAISGFELRIFSEVSGALKGVQHHQIIDGVECDILIDGLPRVAIEVDGRYWHRKKNLADLRKNRLLAERGIIVVRVRDHSLGKLGEHDVIIDEMALETSNIKLLIETVCALQGRSEPKWLTTYDSKESFRYEKKFQDLKGRLPLAMPGRSIAELHPNLAAMWDTAKNAPLIAGHFTPGSKYKAWWCCEKGHSFQRDIYSLMNSSPNCPHCSGAYTQGLKPVRENSFAAKCANLLWSWDHDKNDVTPYDISPGSNKPRFWICQNGHEWEVAPYRRQREGCPICAGYRLSPDRSLAVVAPEVAAEWYQPRNGSFTPSNVGTSSSKIKPWWKCRSCAHEWKAVLYDRAVRKTKCPKCGRRKRQAQKSTTTR